MLTLDTATQNNNTNETIFWRNYSPADTLLSSAQYNERYFTYVSSATDKEYQVDGSANGALTSTKTINYSYAGDAWGNPTSISTTVTDEDSGSAYDGASWTTNVTNTWDESPGTWCLTLLSEQQVSYSASDGSQSVTRTRQYTPDTTNCRYTGITTEPGSNYAVTETLGYDDFGNISSDTVTGHGMTARQTSAREGRVHELADRREDGGDRLIVCRELLLEARLELIEAAGERPVRGEELAHARHLPGGA